MAEKYIIRYKFGGISSDRWSYFISFVEENYAVKNDTYSTLHKDSTKILKMTLIDAKKNVEKIEEIRGIIWNDLIDIQIVDTETNGIIDIGYKEEDDISTSRFDLIDFD